MPLRLPLAIARETRPEEAAQEGISFRSIEDANWRMSQPNPVRRGRGERGRGNPLVGASERTGR